MKLTHQETIYGDQWRSESVLEVNLSSLWDACLTALAFALCWIICGILVITSPIWIWIYPLIAYDAYLDRIYGQLDMLPFQDSFFYELELPYSYDPILISPDLSKMSKEQREEIISALKEDLNEGDEIPLAPLEGGIKKGGKS